MLKAPLSHLLWYHQGENSTAISHFQMNLKAVYEVNRKEYTN